MGPIRGRQLSTIQAYEVSSEQRGSYSDPWAPREDLVMPALTAGQQQQQQQQQGKAPGQGDGIELGIARDPEHGQEELMAGL
ncbi:hypothetical protein Cadr_000003692 [Camelus dromedarius]|uniref:Uncharacterized protein n=1 Tax=Camelus dromedarius TaxID=9838 RepID=A0A5N4C1M0_CAMDR|nr:hypothetical protein Cadr_000003692 [Camelus dromedarius]